MGISVTLFLLSIWFDDIINVFLYVWNCMCVVSSVTGVRAPMAHIQDQLIEGKFPSHPLVIGVIVLLLLW